MSKSGWKKTHRVLVGTNLSLKDPEVVKKI
jgi:hypothetical protein